MKLVLKAIILLLPTILVILVVYVFLGSSINRFMPNFPNDEVGYYRQILMFRTVGFQGGYFTLNELTAPASFSHFGPNGPFFPMVYGTLSLIIGRWDPPTAIVLNVALFTVAFALYLCLTDLSASQLLLLVGVIVTCYVALFHWISVMQESLHQAVGIVLAAIFYRLSQREKPISTRRFAGILAFILFVSLIRYTWSIFLLPLFWHFWRPESWFGYAKPILASAALAALCFFVFRHVAAPYPWSIVSTILSSPAPRETWLVIIGTFLNNLQVLRDSPLFLQVLVGQYLILLIAILSYCIVLTAQKKDIPFWAGLQVVNGLTIFILTVTLYSPHLFAGYRTLALHALVGTLLIIPYRRFRWLVAGVIVSNVIASASFAHELKYIGDLRFSDSTASVDTLRQSLSAIMPVDEATSNAWCNTVIISNKAYTNYALAVPDKIGLSFFYSKNMRGFDARYLHLPFKSKYLWLAERDDQVDKDELHVRLLLVAPVGRIYQNLDSQCP